jgi:hypothetical protein
MQDKLAHERRRIEGLQAQLAAYERSRMNLAKSFFENRRLNDAARVIQRAYREHRNRRHKLAQQQRQQVLAEREAEEIPGQARAAEPARQGGQARMLSR